MAGLVPAIHVLTGEIPREDVDARAKPAHDEREVARFKRGHDDSI
jgi:hypothetical protein